MVCVVQFLFLPAIGRVMTVETHRKTRALASILSLRYRVCVRSRVQSTGTGHRTFGFSSPLFVDICSPLLYHDRPSHLRRDNSNRRQQAWSALHLLTLRIPGCSATVGGGQAHTGTRARLRRCFGPPPHNKKKTVHMQFLGFSQNLT